MDINEALRDGVIDVARRAATEILAVYDGDFAVQHKGDDSPLTAADLAAHRCIVHGLQVLTPDIPVLSEESKGIDIRERRTWRRFWLVDPLDGTREFIKRNGEFTVNIALVDGDRPVAGCVHAPALGELYFAATQAFVSLQDATAPFDAAAARPIAVRAVPAQGAIALVSRSHRDPHTERFLAGVAGVRHESIGSSLKFCRIAAGRADLYPRFGPTMEWDVAAGHAVLQAAGGSVTTPDGAPFRYGKFAAGLRNGPFIARGRRER